MSKVRRALCTEVDYLNLAFNTLSPAHLSFCLALSGVEAVDSSKPFTYAELGSGFGLSVAGWAAQYPHAQFYSVDYNQRQTQWTQQLADMAGLDNLHVYGCPVGDMLSQDLPSFDFVVLHGLYSWVAEDVRTEIREFLAKFLKPGGCAYISYNALPGFKDVEPMRHIIHESIKAAGDLDVHDALHYGVSVLEELRDSGAAFFQKSPDALARLGDWGSAAPAYLVGELLTTQYKYFNFSDIYRELAGIDLLWASSADVSHYLEMHNSPAPLTRLLARWPNNISMQETIKDTFYYTSFRSDIFVKNPQKVSAAVASEVLGKAQVCLAHAHNPLPAHASHHHFSASLDAALYAPMLAILNKVAVPVKQLENLLQQPFAQIVQSVAILMALDWVHIGPASTPAVQERVARFNVSLSTLAGNDVMMPLLSAHGGWVQAREELEYLYVLAQLNGKDAKEYIQGVLRSDTQAESEADMAKAIHNYVEGVRGDMAAFMQRHGLE